MDLYVMVGLPGSGKSYAAEQLREARKLLMGENVCVISRDKIRFELLKEGEDYFKHEKEVFKIFVQRINEALQNPDYDSVIADATHINEVSRYKLLSRLNLENVNIIPIYCETSIQTCFARNCKRSGREQVPCEAIANMRARLVPPHHMEAIEYATIYTVKEDGTLG